MKLFTSNEVVTKKQSNEVDAQRKLINVNELLKNKQLELKRLELDFEYTLTEQQTNWQKELAEFSEKKNLLATQVKELEERRQKKLLPVEKKWEEVERLKRQVEKKEHNLQVKEEALEDRRGLLEEKLTQVAEREQEARKMSQMQVFAQQGIDSQKTMIRKQTEDLNKKMQEVMEDSIKQENILMRRESQILLKEKSIIDREKEVMNKEKGFEDRERQIQDRYEQLQKTIKEINNKYKTNL